MKSIVALSFIFSLGLQAHADTKPIQVCGSLVQCGNYSVNQVSAVSLKTAQPTRYWQNERITIAKNGDSQIAVTYMWMYGDGGEAFDLLTFDFVPKDKNYTVLDNQPKGAFTVIRGLPYFGKVIGSGSCQNMNCTYEFEADGTARPEVKTVKGSMIFSQGLLSLSEINNTAGSTTEDTYVVTQNLKSDEK